MRKLELTEWVKMMAVCGLLLLGLAACGPRDNGVIAPDPTAAATATADLPVVVHPSGWTDCSQSGMGAALMALQEPGASTGPELVSLTEDGYFGLTGTPVYDTAARYFPLLEGWDRGFACNSHTCLRSRAERAAGEDLAYEFLGYGPERLSGVPIEEQSDLPWATQVARDIADDANKLLMISYSTQQLHEEAEERGFGWDNAGEVVALLAPYGDIWLIQAADEYNDPRSSPQHPEPILSQRHFPPGPEWRAEAEKWVNWIRAANPEIEVWIQLALHRIPVGSPPWEDNYPSAELLLAYRDWLVNPEYGSPLVDGVYVSSVYSWPVDPVAADEALEQAIRQACGQEPAPVAAATRAPDPPATQVKPDPPATQVQSDLPASQVQGNIALVEEGWTDTFDLPGITVLPGYYYRIYENSAYPCGGQGNHQFMLLDDSPDATHNKHLFAKFLGGGVGFWYVDDAGQRVYFPQANAAGFLNETPNRNMMFRTSVSEEFANGVTRRMRENPGFRILVHSYCSHDLYHGAGEYDEIDGYARFGYVAAMEAVTYVQQNFATDKVIVYGGSAGAAGFYVGKDQENVAGIVMDSQAVDLSAIRDACIAGNDAFGGTTPCFCPEGGPPCMELLAPRIGFDLGSDEPYRFVERGEVDTPIFLIWNVNDASRDAHYQYTNLHNALRQYNPGGSSVACRVCLPHANPEIPDSCIEDDSYTPVGACNLHVPSGQDYDFTLPLVQDVYDWILERVGETTGP
jgi:hypothetical protein